jgi:hypothetical protein
LAVCLKGASPVGKHSVGDAAKDTGVSRGNASDAHHAARDDAFGSKDGGRDYGSGGDRFGVDRGPMNDLESSHGLGGGKGGKK